MANTKIIPMEKDFAKWYSSIIESAKLITYSNIKGTLIYRPNGWAIWSNIQLILDKMFKNIGVTNVQLPLFIKYSDFNKEKEHVEGFSPEVFLVTKKGEELLTEPYVVRPTSEVLFCDYFKSVINSYRDLPLKLNQWCNVFRSEKNTKPFLRTSEFFWNELHTMHSSAKEAYDNAVECIELYRDFVEHTLCIPTLMGQKTEGERFAGAENTFTIETLMQDGQMLQSGTSHYLGQNFTKTYDIKFTNKENKPEYGYQTSAGMSTRIIGAIIMSHADNKGLVLPFDIAPTQIALIPISFDKNPDVLTKVKELKNKLGKYRTHIDDSDKSFGFKISDQETLGTPINIVLGPKDLQNNCATVVIRNKEEKINISIDQIESELPKIINQYSIDLFNKAKKRLDSSIVEVSSYEELIKAVNERKIALAPWGGTAEDEKKLKLQSGGITPRCIKSTTNNKKCFYTNKSAKYMVYFGRAY